MSVMTKVKSQYSLKKKSALDASDFFLHVSVDLIWTQWPITDVKLIDLFRMKLKIILVILCFSSEILNIVVSFGFLQIMAKNTSELFQGDCSDYSSGDCAVFICSKTIKKNFEVIFDSFWWISAVIRSSCFFHLRSIAKLKHLLFKEGCKSCYSCTHYISIGLLYSALPQSSLSWLQAVQNPAARYFDWFKKGDHISPILSSLHLLPNTVFLKLLLFVRHYLIWTKLCLCTSCAILSC